MPWVDVLKKHLVLDALWVDVLQELLLLLPGPPLVHSTSLCSGSLGKVEHFQLEMKRGEILHQLPGQL